MDHPMIYSGVDGFNAENMFCNLCDVGTVTLKFEYNVS